MIKRILFCLVLGSLSLAPCYAAEPLLIDVRIIGSAQSPRFEPQHLQFDAGQDYLLVISNNADDSITFEYGNFGQQVFTRGIMGTSSMTQQSLVISGKSKVQWHFSPKDSGEYTYYATNTAQNSRGVPGKITVNKIEEPEKDAKLEKAEPLEVEGDNAAKKDANSKKSKANPKIVSLDKNADKKRF